MTPLNIRSLLLAAIFLSNCITWTASRHHYTHNVNGHRSRHRRQGAGLFLSASYVLPGGEGSGWGEWGEVTPCSRTCGGGVASQKRICLQLGPDGEPQCSGGDTKFFSCQTQDCPAGSKDFRAQQCSEYDDLLFRDIKYKWVPYTKASNPCELNCMPHAERFYYRHKAKVTDGTRCNDESFDVCVNGTCQPVGCDMMLGSSAKEDKCRECRGNNANCHTTSGLLDTEDLRKGYNDMLLIPEGATTILIEEVGPSNNYLALRAKNGTFYLNGDYHIDFPRNLNIAGVMWTYERSQQGFAAPDKLRCLGPTNEPLYLSLLLQDDNVGIEYEYSLPIDMAPPQNKRYNWVHEQFTPCSASCGGGFQTRTVSCRSREELEVVDESLCDDGMRPPTNQTCNTHACNPQWVPGAWGKCTKQCGEGGTRSREVTCQKIISNGYPSLVAEKECFDLLGPKPELFQACNENATCPKWFTGPWKPCDKPCDEGKQTRQVVCYKNETKIEVLGDDQCTDERPADQKPCIEKLCVGVDWVMSPWKGCDSCVSTIRTRTAVCATKDHVVVNDSFCGHHRKNTTQENCDLSTLPACEVQWYASQWSNCSVECGKGVQTRNVFCGNFNGDSVSKVNDSLCAHLPKYNDSKICEIPEDKCPSQWFTAPWSACDKKCGGGDQYRRVMCLRGEEMANDCVKDSVPESSQSCNTGPCDADELLPVNDTLSLMEDYEDCEDETVYSEVGLDVALSTEADMMSSDSSSDEGSGESTMPYAELESELSETILSSDSDDETTTDEPNSTYSTTDTDETTTDSTYETTEASSGTETTEDSSEDSRNEKTTKSGYKTSSSMRPTYPLLDEDEELIGETTESGPTETTETTESGATETTETTESGATETTEATESGATETTEATVSGATETTETTESGATETTETTESGATETTETTESGATETTETTVSGATEITETTESGSTETTETTESGATETTETTESGATETTETTVSGATETTETTESGSTETTEITESGATETTETTESGATESTETTESGATETTETTESGSTETTETTESGATETTETTESGATESTETTESGATETTETTESGATETTETTESGATETTETTESGATETTETTESGATETTETTESGATETTETTESGATETTETTEFSSTQTGETTESTSEASSESTSESIESSSTAAEELTSPAFAWTPQKPRMCRPRVCAYTKFGCCPDRKTIAGGPFDEGCPEPEPCKRTKHGCCPDGITAATAPNHRGCPMPPCNETLFGCCRSDNKTAAEGNDQEGCPPPPPACESSKYGCCRDGETEAIGPAKEGCPETSLPETEPPTSTTPVYEGCENSEYGCCFDNETEATGPDHQGCPCGTSEYGCCLDGVTTALGPDFEGCVKNCNSSAYGCCPDGTTPAHGPNREGCCLRSAFGCCPDNYNYARGPHLEGCGCQYSPYGCCPDNVTSASGRGNKGCDCSYSPHGCCPDGHTESSGPGFEGCACHTYQFGCCPDGVTIARGPDGQGCHCLQSKFKCCGDGETHATGPNQEGCDCSSSKYGCCPDGQTEATGPKFKGCTDAPINKQAACGLSFARGPCRNYSVHWYFDTEYGGCSRFWYGGCEGNGNRFTTKEDCEDTCVSPPPKDACKLPQSKGACLAYNIRWYYDSQRESCTNFAYGGCLGNNNNFETRELCQKQCEPQKTTEQCSLPIEQGSCAGNFPRWGFNQQTRTCEQFTWGGCEGNPNRFSTEAACNLRCNPPGQPKPECSQPQEVGNCTETEAVWSFSQTENRCVPFYYTGCGGNENRFMSVDSCEASCPSAYVPDKCTLPYETGNCANYREKWYFDTKDQRCRQFYYGGCGGNTNNFDSESECQSECELITTTTTAQPTAPHPTAPTQQARPQPADRQDFCFLEADAGPCNNFSTKWAYDYKTGRCMTFQYGGCAGNRNNFPDVVYCQYYCKATQDICQLPMLSGPCDDSQMRWFYDASTDTCSQFTYGGCDGNENRFQSREECESRCKTGPAVEQTTVTVATPVVSPSGGDIPAICNISPTLEPCSPERAGEVWYQNPSTHECIPHENTASGDSCRTTGVFTSEESCERSCGAFRGISNVCAYPLDTGRCSSIVPKYFYNGTSRRCEEFSYGGCMGGPNRFSTELECLDICKPVIEPCKQQPDAGNCLARYELWYYDESMDQCNQFIYGGCGGNDNRFESRDECEGRCKQQPGEVAVTTTTTQAPQPLDPECVTPDSLDPCGANETVFYYDSSTSTCRVADFGGCRYGNSYGSEEECERHCGAFRGLDVCRAQVNPGPCRAAIPKYYFDAATGACKEFTYGGCQGGPNRFSTIDECEVNCREVGPAPACLQEVAIGEPCGVLPSRRWFYSPARASCLVFAYQGCGGNDNNFVSYEECTDRCNVISTDSESQAALCYSYSEECEALESTCEYGIRITVASEGCQRCACEEPPNCERQRQECDTLRCPYGIERISGDDGCQICKCLEDPCIRANCSTSERCVASAFRDPATQSVHYSAHCIPDTDTNEVLPECEQYEEHCAQLVCTYAIQRTKTAQGCVRCACVQEEVDCALLRQECENLKCAYGVDRIRGEDGCERCKCLQHPCTNKQCPEKERCVLTPYRDPITNENRYLTDCRSVEKAGTCPVDNTRSTESACRPDECRDDADCRGVGKCCTRGCSRLCLVPEEPTIPTTLVPVTQHLTTYSPDAPQAPRVNTETEPEVSVAEGGKATLRCIFHGNPPPKITWHFGEITIDGDFNRYRLLSDGALEIVSLVQKDSGVYICVGNNELGSAQQEIRLVVNDPVPGPAYIAGDVNAVVIGELGQPLEVRCRAYGYPRPDIYWSRGHNGPLVPLYNTLYEARDVLTIRRLSTETLGVYVCYAYNGQGKMATWEVTVKGYQPDDMSPGPYLVPRVRVVAVTPRELTTTSTTTTTTTTTTPRPVITTPWYIDAPQAPQVSSETEPQVSVAEGGKATLRCIFHGNPPPKITWSFGEITIDGDFNRYRLLSDGALEIISLVRNDSGVYICIGSNDLGTAQQEIRLVVNDPVPGPAYIAGDGDTEIIGELGQPLEVRCRAYGYPRPDIYWYRGRNGPLVPFSDKLYEARDQILTIRMLSMETLGKYACYAYNGQGKPAIWEVTVKGYQTDDSPYAGGEYLVPRGRVVAVTPRDYITTTTERPEFEPPPYIVEVQTQLLPAATTVSAGTELSLPCNVDGYPEPRVTWTKDGVQLSASETLWITGTRLTIPRATLNDSGIYGCHAANQYSTHSSTVQITVQEMVIPSKCTDSTYFANCALIVQGKFCRHKYYSKFCCKSCVEAGQLDPSEVDMQSDEPYRKK